MTVGTEPLCEIVLVDFAVVKLQSSINVIMGRPAMNSLKAFWSSYHLVMKFPTSHGIASVRGDQSQARRCQLVMKSNFYLILPPSLS